LVDPALRKGSVGARILRRICFRGVGPEASSGRTTAVTSDQQVRADGGISIPYAGRVPAAGYLPDEARHTIEMRLAEKALEPQTLVIVRKSAANAVTVMGEAISGSRIPLSPGGDRLLELMVAAGGANAPVYDAFVQLSRDGVTATIPLHQLVSTPPKTSMRSRATY
jgi:polysaccharide export outer membrane protein